MAELSHLLSAHSRSEFNYSWQPVCRPIHQYQACRYIYSIGEYLVLAKCTQPFHTDYGNMLSMFVLRISSHSVNGLPFPSQV